MKKYYLFIRYKCKFYFTLCNMPLKEFAHAVIIFIDLYKIRILNENEIECSSSTFKFTLVLLGLVGVFHENFQHFHRRLLVFQFSRGKFISWTRDDRLLPSRHYYTNLCYLDSFEYQWQVLDSIENPSLRSTDYRSPGGQRSS